MGEEGGREYKEVKVNKQNERAVSTSSRRRRMCVNPNREDGVCVSLTHQGPF